MSSPAEACVVCGERRSTRRFVKHDWTFARCVTCGHTALAPLPSPEALRRHHEASYQDGRYATFAAADDARVAVAAQRHAAVERLAPPGPWLDVGCSTGALLAQVVAAGRPGVGVEVSPAAADAARARGLTVHTASIEAYAPETRHAVVSAFDVVEHLPDPGAFLARAAGWIRDDGLLALTLPNAASVMARGMGRHWFYYTAPDHVHYFTPATITRLLTASGYRDVHVRSITKPLPLGYAARQLREMVPPLAPIAAVLDALARTALGGRPLPLPLGEMLVTARPAPRRSAR